MKRLSLTGFLMLPLFALLGSLPAAEPATGAVTGRVQNVATGQYLNNARITVRETGRTAFTDESGQYVVPALASGSVTLEFYYTGLDPAVVTVPVAAGQTVERNIDLTSVGRYGRVAETVKLDPFVVATARETNAQAIAVNEQRFAPNLKNVISADALGSVTDGNVGEFLKYLPGITAEYNSESGTSVASVAVRGFPSSMTVVSSDGLQLANTSNSTGQSRVFEFSQASINNTARLEVTKVPLPSTPADTMAGSVNMVSKSAFERREAQIRYSVGFTANHPYLDVHKSPYPSDRSIHHWRPSANFDYTLPITRNFGLVVTGQSENKFMYHQAATKAYNATAAGTGATFSRPFLQQFSLAGNAPRINARNSLAVKADWRVSTHGVLSINAQANRYVADRAAISLAFDTGTAPTPTIANGVPLTFGDNFTNGASGRGTVTLMGGTGAALVQALRTRALSSRYRFDNGDWRIESNLGVSKSDGGTDDLAEGRFRNLDMVTRVPVRVVFADINAHRPQVIQVFDNNNQPFDYGNPENYTLRNGNSSPRFLSDGMLIAKLDVRKHLAALPFPAALQIGGQERRQTRDNRREGFALAYAGPDGNTATADSPTPFAMSTYVNQKESFGFRDIRYVSVDKAWAASKASPSPWIMTPAQSVTKELTRIRSSEWFNEGVSALYFQAEMGLWRNRLRVVTGVRYEKTQTKGQGVLNDPNGIWLRDADGSFAHNAAGARSRKPEAGASGSMEELAFLWKERGARANRTYDGYYPSLHLTYSVGENLLARLAYAKTYGRPDLTNVLPNSTIAENDLEVNPNLVPGRITIRNVALRPWTADNVDFSLEYYTPQGGVLSAGAFTKEIKDFFGSALRLATPADLELLSLGSEFKGWEVSSTFNLPGTARVRGFEFNVRHSLGVLGAWGRPFQVFANATKLQLAGDQAANFSAFIPKSANWGFSFSRDPFTAIARWNYRGLQKRGASTAVNGFGYSKARTMLDLNLEYRLHKRLSAFVNVQNVLNVSEEVLTYGPVTPAYARPTQVTTYGPQLYLGVKGTF